MSAKQLQDGSAFQLLAATQSLQASHEITSQLERSKFHAEHVIDSLPNAYGIIDEKGNVFKANSILSQLMSTDIEKAIGHNIKSIFKEQTWNIFKEKIRQLEAREIGSGNIDFELIVDSTKSKSCEYIWSIHTLPQLKGNFNSLYQILGRDISDVKETEKRLTQIFSCIPLGIMTIEGSGTVVGPYSNYVEHLLETKDVDGKSLYELLFKKSTNLDDETRNRIEIHNLIGIEETWFDMECKSIPTELQIKCDNNPGFDHRWIGLTLHPVLSGDSVEKILVVLQDKTSVINSRFREEKDKEIQEQVTRRIVEIKKCEEILLKTTMEELQDLQVAYDEELRSFNKEKILNTLHTIKGLARTAGFSSLKDLAHDTESALKDASITEWEKSVVLAAEVTKELTELLGLTQVLNQDKNRENPSERDKTDEFIDSALSELKSLIDETGDSKHVDANSVKGLYNYLSDQNPMRINLREYEAIISMRANHTARELRKEISLTFDWKGISLSKRNISKFGEIALHFINNAIDHGIESPKDRINKGKEECGNIQISANQMENGHIKFSIADDGGGFR
ncbi:MAG: Hpt domain-containing protein [Pseudobacteriovorax sp.]|nr:Hpt domain-containing protein [Pseudobacteriovorax sp.]